MNLDVNTDGQRNTLLKSDLISGDPHLGLECGYRDVVFLRAGVGNIQQKMDLNLSENWTFMPNLGVGVKFKQVILDYALSDIGNQSSAQYSHVFSIRASINPKP
jgi:hypothetical protein